MTPDSNPDQRFAQIRQEYRFSIMLISLVCLMTFDPFFYDYRWAGYLINLIFSVIILSSIYAISYRKYATLIAVFFALPVLVIKWSGLFVDYSWQPYVRDIFSACFFIFIILLMLDYIFRQIEVTRETLFAAIVVYLLLGLMWSVIFRFVETLQPGSFHLPHEQTSGFHSIFLYYSFVTLTTLGY